jgi:hypothetical protein
MLLGHTDELPLGDQASDRNVGEHATANHQMTVRRKDFDKSTRELFDTESTVQRLEVIEYQDKILADAEHLIDQIAHDGGRLTEEVAGPGFQSLTRPFPKPGELLANSADEISHEKGKISIALVNRVPADRNGGSLGKIHESRGLTIASRGRDQR